MNKILEQLQQEQTHKIKSGLYHLTQIKLAYNSNRIEGSRLSEEQTRYIFETNTIDTLQNEALSVDDITETINHFTCFDFMLQHAKEDLSETMIKKFHYLLKRNTLQERLEWFKVGDYKIKPNFVGNTKTTSPNQVATEISRLLKNYQTKTKIEFEDIIDYHVNFEKIHPFQDGNGRVGRMILFKECLKNQIMPFIIDEKHKLFYYRGLQEYQNEKGYLLETCRSAQDDYEKIVKYFI